MPVIFGQPSLVMIFSVRSHLKAAVIDHKIFDINAELFHKKLVKSLASSYSYVESSHYP